MKTSALRSFTSDQKGEDSTKLYSQVFNWEKTNAEYCGPIKKKKAGNTSDPFFHKKLKLYSSTSFPLRFSILS
jgi:hypothetical protein